MVVVVHARIACSAANLIAIIQNIGAPIRAKQVGTRAEPEWQGNTVGVGDRGTTEPDIARWHWSPANVVVAGLTHSPDDPGRRILPTRNPRPPARGDPNPSSVVKGYVTPVVVAYPKPLIVLRGRPATRAVVRDKVCSHHPSVRHPHQAVTAVLNPASVGIQLATVDRGSGSICIRAVVVIVTDNILRLSLRLPNQQRQGHEEGPVKSLLRRGWGDSHGVIMRFRNSECQSPARSLHLPKRTGRGTACSKGWTSQLRKKSLRTEFFAQIARTTVNFQNAPRVQNEPQRGAAPSNTCVTSASPWIAPLPTGSYDKIYHHGSPPLQSGQQPPPPCEQKFWLPPHVNRTKHLAMDPCHFLQNDLDVVS